MRETELMEIYPNEMNEDSEVNKKEESSSAKKKNRNHNFHCVAKNAGRGVNGSLKTLNEKDTEGNIINTHTKRKTITEEITNHNKNTSRWKCKKSL